METYKRYYNQFEHGFFANSTLGVLVQSCMGGMAAMAVLSNGNSLGQMIQLFVVVMLCIGYNMSLLSLQKPKVVFNMLLLSMVVNTGLFVVNLVN